MSFNDLSLASDDVGYLTFEQSAAAFRRFGETEETRKVKLAELAVVVRNHPYHHIFDSRPANLIKYLRGQQFDVKKAAKVIENRINFNMKHPAFAKNLSAAEFAHFRSVVHILDVRDRQGRVIIVVRPAKYIEKCTSKYVEENPKATLRFNIFVNQQLSNHVDAQIYGTVILYSFKDVTSWQLHTIKVIAPFHERLLYGQFQNTCSPVQIGGLYYFEEPFYFRWMWNTAKPFLSSEWKKNIHLCGNYFDILNTVMAPGEAHKLPTIFHIGTYDLELKTKGRNWLENHSRDEEEEVPEEKREDEVVPFSVPDLEEDMIPDRPVLLRPEPQPVPAPQQQNGLRNMFGGARNNRVVPTTQE